MSIKNLIADVVEETEEQTAHDMENGGGSFINACGVYPTTIEKAFLTETKKGGIKLDLMLGGANMIDLELYIISKKNGRLVTTCKIQGKTVSLPSYKIFKQLYFIATGTGLDLKDMELKTETIKYKKYGKAVEVEGDTIVQMIGKEIQVGIRLEESYAYEDGETDKTQLRTNKNGDTVYDKDLHSVFSKDGLSPMEIVNEATEAKEIESVKTFLASDKAIKKVKLEFPDEPEESEEEPEDEIDF